MRCIFSSLCALAICGSLAAAAEPGSSSRAGVPPDYKGKPFQDSVYKAGAQVIPGKVQCTYFDMGGEGVAFHSDGLNHGSHDSERPRPKASAYIQQFRGEEEVSISYASAEHGDHALPTSQIPFTLETNQLYIGWTQDGQWLNYTVNVKKAGTYKVNILYASQPTTFKLLINRKPAGDYTLPVKTGSVHAWNLANVGTINFPEPGLQLLTFEYKRGNNLAYFDFEPGDKAAEPAKGTGPAKGAEAAPAKPAAEPAAVSPATVTGPNVVKGAKVEFVAPVLGTKTPITGKVTGLTPIANYQIAVLVSNDQKIWWDKTHNVKGVPIKEDGTFAIPGRVVDPHDLTVQYIGIWVVPSTFGAVHAEGAQLPEKLVQASVAALVKSREAPATVIGAGVIKGAKVEFVAPVLGTDSPITGKVTGLTPLSNYQIAVLVSRDQKKWWDKTHNVHGVPIKEDGTFTISGWAFDPHTLTTPYIGIWVVPSSFGAVHCEGAPLPEKLVQAAVAALVKSREAGPEPAKGAEPAEGAEPAKSTGPAKGAGQVKAAEPAKSAEPTKDAPTVPAKAPAAPAAASDTVTGPNVIKGAKVEFVAPVLGTKSPITGKVTGLAPLANFQIAVLVSKDQKIWWDKTHNVRGVPIKEDGTFTISGWVVDPHDLTVPYIGIWVVPSNFGAVHAEGAQLPEKLVQASVAALIKSREAGPGATKGAEPAKGAADSSATSTIPGGYSGKPYGGKGCVIPGIIQAEDYDVAPDNTNDVTFHYNGSGPNNSSSNQPDRGGRKGEYRTTADSIGIIKFGGGHVSITGEKENPDQFYLGSTHDGEWMKYTIHVAEAGTYLFGGKFAATGKESKLSVTFTPTLKIIGPVSIPTTAGFQTAVETYHVWLISDNLGEVTLPAGNYVMQITIEKSGDKRGGLNLDYFTFIKKP